MARTALTVASVEIDSKQLSQLLAQGGPRAVKALGQGLYKEATEAFARSQQEVPVDTGALRASGQVSRPMLSGRDTVVEITYGGAAADYAIYVHENLEAFHNPGKKAKFLEDPVKQQIQGMGTRLMTAVRRGLGI